VPTRSEPVFEQSAVIPYRLRDGRVEVALVTSRGGKRWIIPKGFVDDAESNRKAAEREAFEEAGLRGDVSQRRVGVYTYRKWGGVCVVHVFTMLVVETAERWPEDSLRSRRWFSLDSAARRLGDDHLRDMLYTTVGRFAAVRRKSA